MMTMGTATAELIDYRPWRGRFRHPRMAIVAIARVSLRLMFRQRIMWVLAGLGLFVFFFFFYAQYLFVWVEQQLAQETVRIAGFPVQVSNLLRFLDRLALNGTAHTFGNYIWFQGYVVIIALAWSGSVLLGNDALHGSMVFYVSKPISLFDYLLGKASAMAVLINALTTVPAVVLWLEAGLLLNWRTYYWENWELLLGILGYGVILTVVLSLLTAATAVSLRRTVPLVIVWMGLFVLSRLLANWLTQVTQDERWRLLDIWNDLYLCGVWCLGVEHGTVRPQPQPGYGAAALAVGVVCGACLALLAQRMGSLETTA